MNPPFYQLAIFSAEAVSVVLFLLILLHLRTHFGLVPLYVTLGVFQPIQVLLASSLYIDKTQQNSMLDEKVGLCTLSLERESRELEKFNKLFLDREFRITELTGQVKKLEDQLKSRGQGS